MKARIVMDIDDTISTHRNRDYENATPNFPMIKKMQELSKKGIEFVLYTARGQISCNGDIKKIEEEKGPTLRRWLARYGVPYLELHFGKPIADVYIDDAAMTPDEFLNGVFESYKGGSNECIERLDKYVIKECNKVNALDVNDWFDKAREYGYNVPKVYSRTYNKMRMEYLEGKPGHIIPFNENKNLATDIAMIIISFNSVPGNYTFDAKKYVEHIHRHINGLSSDKHVKKACKHLMEYKDMITPSFCHGDLTMMNVIVKDKKIYMIDPSVNNDFSSYMLDLAKLRMSLNRYNQLFYNGRSPDDEKRHLMTLDRILKKLNIINQVKALEYTCWVRLINYRKDNPEDFAKLEYELDRIEKEVNNNGK